MFILGLTETERATKKGDSQGKGLNSAPFKHRLKCSIEKEQYLFIFFCAVFKKPKCKKEAGRICSWWKH